MINLRSLKLDLSSIPNLSDNGLIALSEALSKLQDLGSLKLVINSDIAITDNGFIRFVESLSNLSKLTSLTLSISSLENLQENSFTTLGSCLSNMKNLVSLNLECQYISAGHEGIISVCEGISNLSALTSLVMSLNLKPQSDWSQLVGLFAKIDSLSKLELSFGMDSKFNFTFDEFSQLKSLTKFKLTAYT